jgi:hypothetical protein
MGEAVEVTTFRLVGELTMADFIEANHDINVWLRGQKGFKLRRTWEDGQGKVVDMLLWASAADGHRAARGIVIEMATSPVHAVIDQSTVNWSISAVLFGLNM